MFFSFFLMVLFIGIAGVAIGSLAAIKVWYSMPFFILMFGGFCFASLWFGVLIGAAFFSWVPLIFTRIIIIIYCIWLIVYFFKQFHPSYGYIPFRGWSHWGFLTLFFFIIGIDFAIIGLSGWLLFILLPIFAGAIILGTQLIWKLKTTRTAGSFIIYIPLILFMFLALVKLV